ncbi:MAG: dUTP pyrophosphatase [Patescibacteria group bacterium]|nr:dUTP pyrophosphatase [Patescibacteria group bacterium]
MTSKHGARHTPLFLDHSNCDFDGLTVPSLMTVVNERVWTEQMKVTRLKIKVVNMQISFRRLSPDAVIPEYKTTGACAFDIAVTEEKTLQPGERALLSTGLVVAVPTGHALLLFSRSSNAKKGIRLSNSVGVVDQDYCGPTDELKCALHNFGQEPYTVQKGERVAQGLIVPIARGTFTEAAELNAPDRGGFGTTG